jgi:hypothetical protein
MDRLFGQSSWLQIQRCGFDSLRYQIFWEVVGLERGPLILVSAIEELLERKGIGSGLEIREYGRRDPSRLPRGTLYPQKLALSSPTSGDRSVGIVRLRTQAAESRQHEMFCVLLQSCGLPLYNRSAGLCRAWQTLFAYSPGTSLHQLFIVMAFASVCCFTYRYENTE